jgi:CHAT domain-containing protein/Tfp pilus assembly protein PilF
MALTGLAAVSGAQTQPEAWPLEAGVPIERELAPPQQHAYVLTLTPGQYTHVVVDQRGIDVQTVATAPSGAEISTFDSSNTQGPESIWIVAGESGAFRLVVSAVSTRAPAGRYEIRIADLRAADDRDRQRVATQKLLLEAETLTVKGTADALREAIPKYERALTAWRALNEVASEQDTLTDLAGTYQLLRDNPNARRYYSTALTSFRATGNRRRESLTLNNLGLIDNDYGEYQSALDHFNQALTLFRQQKSRGNEATTLASIGLVHSRLGQPEKALDFYTQALTVYRELGIRNGEAIALHGLGQIHTTLRDYQKALDYYTQALPLFRSGRNQRREAQVLGSLGSVYAVLGDRERARANLTEALSISRTTGERGIEAQALHGLAVVDEMDGDRVAAAKHFTEALNLRRVLGDRAGEANSLAALARLSRAAGRLQDARAQIERSIERIESLRTAVARQELRSSYLASKQDEYEFYVDLLMQLHRTDPSIGYATLALEAADRARARSLLDVLAEARAEIRKDVSADLLERERALQAELNAKENARIQVLGGRHTDADAAAIQRDVDALLTSYQEIQARIRSASPRYAALTEPRRLNADNLGSRFDADTLLLEYALGEQRSFLWVVTAETLQSFELPGRADIEKPARRLHELLGRGPQRVIRTQIGLASAELSRMLLAPVAPLMRGKRLLVVTTGVLQYVPFAMLPDPSAQDTSQPLVVDHEISYLPSASMLAVLHDDERTHQRAPRTIAVIADPVFDKSDPRTGGAAPPRAAQPDAMRFERLVFSRREAETIEALVPASEAFEAVDFAASRATATSRALGDYRIVHFATHTVINSAHPELSGIVLSLVDEKGASQDGFLRAHEIYNLRLGADLVVLSGCQTALGQEIRGEGLIGLTRGFMYAGVPRIVASLWNVRDAVTSELMQRFYRGLLQKRLTPAAALRAAQVSMWREARWSAPYQWAGFVLQGLSTALSGH